MNNISLLGRITTDLTITKKGDTKYCKFNLAVKRPLKDKESDFIPCVIFGKQAENFEKYLKKGKRIGVVGHLQVTQYEKEGSKLTSFSVIVENFYFADEKEKDQEE